MKTIKIGKYDWYLAKELADKTILFATENIVEGYFDDNSNNYAESKANAFLTTIFLKNLTSSTFDVNKIVNGIWLLTSIQYENYIKPLNLPISAPFLLRTPGDTENTIKCVNKNGEVIDIGIKEKAGIRPCFMIDTSYVNELINKQLVPENQKKTESVSETKNMEDSTSSIDPKNNDNNKNSVSVSTERQNIENRLKVPVTVPNAPINNNQNNTHNNVQNKDNQEPQKNNQNHQRNNQNNQKDNSQNNKKQKNKKKKAKNKKIETVKPVVKNKVDINSVYEVNNDELTALASVDFSEEDITEVEVAIVKDTSENKVKESTPIDAQQINESISDNIKENIEQPKKENEKEVNQNEKNATVIIEGDSSEIPEKTMVNPEESRDLIDADIVEIETLPEIITEPSPKDINIISDEVKIKNPSPFVKNPNKNKDNIFKKMNKTNNETFVSTTQQNAKKGQDVIMSKLGAKNMPEDNEMSTAITAYTSGNANATIHKQSAPSTYSQNMSDINQFTIDQLRDILIKRNKQITKLKLSLIEVTAEHEAMLENISKTKTEIENYKTEIESLNNKIETLQKTIKKNEQSVTDEKEDVAMRHQKDIDKMTESLNEANENLEKTKAELNALIERNSSAELRVSELQKVLDEKETEIKECKEMLENHSCTNIDVEQVAILNEKIAEAKAENEKIISENTTLAEQLKKATEVIEAQKQELSENKQINVEDVGDIQKLENEITTMKADMVKALRIAKKLKEDLDAETQKTILQSTTIKELTEKLNELHSENSGLKTDIERFKGTLEETYKKVSETEDKLKLSKEKEEELQSVIGNNTMTMHDMAAEISSLRKQNKALADEVAKSNTLTKALLSSDKEKEEKINELMSQLEEAQKNTTMINSYEKTISNLKNDIAEKEAQIKTQENELIEKDRVIKELTDNINSSYNDLTDFKNLIFNE